MNVRQLRFVMFVAASVAWGGSLPLIAQQPRAFEDLPELVRRWERPLNAAGYVSFQPDGKKALFVDAEAVNVFDVNSGKVLRVIPHDLPEFASITCTQEDLAVETEIVLPPHKLRVGKIGAMKRAVKLDLRGPCYASNISLLACIGDEGGVVFGNERGQWGSPKWQFEMDDALKIGFVDNDRLVFAVSQSGEFLTADSETGKTVASGKLDNWPGRFSLGLGLQAPRRVAIVGACNRLLVTTNDEIRVYDVVKPTLLPAIKSVAYPRSVVARADTSKVIVRVGVSETLDATKEGKRRAIVLDAVTAEVSGRIREADALNAITVSPDGQTVLTVSGTKGKKGRMSWTLELLDVPGK